MKEQLHNEEGFNNLEKEGFPLIQKAEEVGQIFSNIKNIERLTAVETPYGIFKRLDQKRTTDIPPDYINKKNIFAGDILDTPTVIVHFSGEKYGQDENYFRREYQTYKGIFNGENTKFIEKKFAPALLGFSDKTMTLITEKAVRDLEFYFSSNNKIEIERISNSFVSLIKDIWEQSKTESEQFPRYVESFLKPEYPFLENKKIENYLNNADVIYLYRQIQDELNNYIRRLKQIHLKSGFGFGDVKAGNLIEDKDGNILFVDVGRPGYYHWLSVLRQLYQDTIKKAPNSLFAEILKEKTVKILENELRSEPAVELFALGRMNRILIPCTLRNIIFNSEIGRRVDEEEIQNMLIEVEKLMKTKSIEEII